MNLDEIREIVDFMKENGLCELEYQEKNSAIRLKLAPPPFRGKKPHCPPPPHEEPEEELYPDEEAPAAQPFLSEEKREEMKQAAAEVRQAAADAAAGVKQATYKAAGAAGERLSNVADYLKSKRDEHLAGGTPGAYDVEVEVEDAQADEPEENDTPSNPYEGLLDENDVESEETPAGEEAPAKKVKLNTEAAKNAAKQAAAAVGNTAKAGITLGAAGLKRGRTFLSDLLGKKDETVAAAQEETVWATLDEEEPKEDAPEETAEQPEEE